MSDQQTKLHDPRTYWLDDPKNIKKLIVLLCVISAGLLIVDAFYEKHAYFAAEYLFGFYPVFGVVMCLGVVIVAKLMRAVLQRDEEYYDKNE